MLRAEEPPHYRCPAKGSIADAAEPLIREQLHLQLDATMPATVIAERAGWQNPVTVLRVKVAERRPLYRPPSHQRRAVVAAVT